MLKWDGILDSHSNPDRVWLTRFKDSDPWTPLRKCDCKLINKSAKKGDKEVLIEFGRATADLEKKEVRYNFHNTPGRQLCSALWFQKHKKSEKDATLTPINSTNDELLIEEFYLQIINSSPFQEKSNLKQEVILTEDEGYKVYVEQNGNSVSIHKRPISVMANIAEGSTKLQRGYGNYDLDGEKEETALGPVSHLSFIVHGIGEKMWKREDVKVSGVVESADQMRITVNKKLYDSWKEECRQAEKKNQTAPPPPNRIEFISVEWFDQIHSSSSALKNNLLSTTLGTIPKLRAIANDVLFDVLMYLTPEFCEEVLNCVVGQINDLYDSFQKIHGHFSSEGSVSLMGHSLGSVIVWDILSILGHRHARMEKGTVDNPIIIDDHTVKSYPLPMDSVKQSADVYRAYATDTDVEVTSESGTWGPSLVHELKQTIPFIPRFTFFVGSPLGIFLTLRGARPVFDKLRILEDEKNKTSETLQPTSPFCLPSGAVYNIFHPSDPVAYRIEPLLLPTDFDESNLPKPAFVKLDGERVRFHVQAKELGDTLVKTFTNLFDRMPSQRSVDVPEIGTEGGKRKKTKGSPPTYNFALGGKSARVDLQLQTGVIDNEYVSAVLAHSTYWTNDDFLNFFIQCTKDEYSD